MFKYSNKLLPQTFDDIFRRINEIHEYDTRRAGEFYVPTCRTRLRQFSINYQGPLFYNALSLEIRGALTLSLFKKKLKLYLFARIHTI
jgi:hypothetical protein